MRDWIKCMRIKHYIKNLLIFVPFVFGYKFQSVDDQYIKNLLFGFLGFCLMSSAIYIINDWNDRSLDCKHMLKGERPIAAGRISKGQVVIAVLILLLLVMGCCVKIPIKGTVYLGLYLLLNLLYSKFLKKLVVIDVFVLSLFYVLRIYYGGALVEMHISHWLYLTVQCLALYLSLAKRLGESKENQENGVVTRDILKKYPQNYLSEMMNLFMGMAFVFYSLWAATVLENMMLTVPIVLVALLRYQYNVTVGKDSDPIEMIYKDKWLLLCIALYVIVVFLMIS